MRYAPTRRDERGFVLVTTLLVLVILAVLATSLHFVATTNLDVARNTYAAAEAEFAANEGLDLAILALQAAYDGSEGATWPEAGDLVPSSDRYAVETVAYVSDDDGTVTGGHLTVTGYGRGSAVHRATAHFTVGSDTRFEGWQTTNDVTLNGRMDLSIPLAANGSIRAPAARDARPTDVANASPLGTSGIRADGTPHECDLGKGGRAPECRAGAARVPDQALNRADLVADWGDGCRFTFTGSVSIDASAYPPGTRLCLGDGAEATLRGEASGLTVVGGNDTTVRIEATSTDADGLATPFGLRVSAATVAPGDGMRLTGTNTLLAERDVVFDARRAAIEGTPGPDGGTIIGTLVASEGNVRFERKPSTVFHTAVFAEGSVCKRGGGGMDFTGPIYARARPDIDIGRPCQRGIYWNGGGGGAVEAVANPGFLSATRDPDAPPPGVSLRARRP
mgnify:FL=1